MSEFDILNGKLDMILSRLDRATPTQAAPGAWPTPVQPSESPAPAPAPTIPQTGAFPHLHTRGRTICSLFAGLQYRCWFPEQGGYAISVEQGRGARILTWLEGTPQPGWDQAAVDAATIMSGPMTAWLVMTDKDCLVNMDG